MPCRADFKKDAFLYWKVQDTDRLNLWDEAGKRLSVLKRTPLTLHCAARQAVPLLVSLCKSGCHYSPPMCTVN